MPTASEKIFKRMHPIGSVSQKTLTNTGDKT